MKSETTRQLAKEEPRFVLQDYAMRWEVVPAEEEKCYRRGYSQGFSIARQYVEIAMKHGVSCVCILNELHKCESKLMRWRWDGSDWIRGQPVKVTEPPRPNFPTLPVEEKQDASSDPQL